MNEKIHFDDFVEQVALEAGYDIDTAKAYVVNMFETIVEESANGRNVKVKNFGSFQPRYAKAKRGINPQTQQPLDILPHYHIHYAVSKGLEQTLNSGEKVTKITINEKPNILGRVVLVALGALLITLFYRSFFMPETELQKLPTQQATVPVKEVVAPKAEEKASVATPKVEEPAPVVEVIKHPEQAVIKKRPALPTHYTVKKGQTLSEISLELYGSSIYWPLLFENNKDTLSSPDLIFTGMTLKIPKASKDSTLQDAYLDAYNSYLSTDNLSKSFWTLCSGARYMGESFVSHLSGKIPDSDFMVVKRCSQARDVKSSSASRR